MTVMHPLPSTGGKSFLPEMLAFAELKAARDTDDQGGKRIEVHVPRRYLDSLPAPQREQECIRMMRKRGIPINGSHTITGLRHGFLQVVKGKGNDLYFFWWPKDPRPGTKHSNLSHVLTPDS